MDATVASNVIIAAATLALLWVGNEQRKIDNRLCQLEERSTTVDVRAQVEHFFHRKDDDNYDSGFELRVINMSSFAVLIESLQITVDPKDEKGLGGICF